jgi:hypothetical protein
MATGGSHVTSNDFFLSNATKTRLADIADQSKEKKTRTQKFDVQQAALKVLETKSLEAQAASNYVCLTGKECHTLIRYHNGVPKVLAKDKVIQWKAICDGGTKPPVCSAWTDEEEQKLQRLMTGEITMEDTSLGRSQNLMKRELIITAADMGNEEWNSLVAKRQILITNRNAPPTETPTVGNDPMDDAARAFQKWIDAGEQKDTDGYPNMPPHDAVAIVSVLLPKVDMMNTTTNCTSAVDCFVWLKDGARGLRWQDEMASMMPGKKNTE